MPSSIPSNDDDPAAGTLMYHRVQLGDRLAACRPRVGQTMRIPFIVVLVSVSTGCFGTSGVPYSVPYGGASEAERKLLQDARRDVYPDDVRPAPEKFQKSTLAWPGRSESSLNRKLSG